MKVSCVSLTQTRITWDERPRELWSTLGWLVNVSLGAVVLISELVPKDQLTVSGFPQAEGPQLYKVEKPS